MGNREIQFQKKREFGEILTDSFEFLKQEYKPISKLILIYVLPFIVLYAIVQVKVQMKLFGVIDLSDPETMMSNIGPFYFNVFITSLFSLFVQSLLIATYYSYIEIYVKKGKGNFDLAEITPLLFSNGLLALLANLVVFVIIVIGIFLCFVPGIYFANTFSLVVTIFIFEKKGLGDSMSRSWKLVHTQWWNTFLLGIIGIIIIWTTGMILSIPSMLAGITNTVFSLQETGNIEQPDWFWVLTGITSVVSSLLAIILYTFFAMQYFNLDERTKPEKPASIQ